MQTEKRKKNFKPSEFFALSVLHYEGLTAAFCVGPGVAAQKNKGRAG